MLFITCTYHAKRNGVFEHMWSAKAQLSCALTESLQTTCVNNINRKERPTEHESAHA